MLALAQTITDAKKTEHLRLTEIARLLTMAQQKLTELSRDRSR
jgi:hypothetical protein